MKNDIEALMEAKDLDAMIITGPAQHNPAMFYLTGNVHITHGDLILRRGEEPVLFYNPMERDEAQKTGFKTVNLSDYDYKALLKSANGDRIKASATRYSRMLQDLDITSGNIAIYGKVELGGAYPVFTALTDLLPGLKITGELGNSVLIQAMSTKDNAEIDRMVVGEVADYLTSQNVKDEILIDKHDNPITIGKIKRLINLWLAERGAENPQGTIFAIGRDAGVPHSTGNPDDYLQLGKTIVFDIFPCEMGGGYYYDFTRTWCLGYAPDEAQSLYDDVYDVYTEIMNNLKANQPCKSYQEMTCKLFEARGHVTIMSQPNTQEGYVHSLGHGLGLHVHEEPNFSMLDSNDDVLAPGVVITVEPGLYYPEKGMGCRLEDTITVLSDGRIEKLAEFPMDLVLPVKR
jgi:Xaa-Pro aminopeptidase